MTRPTWRILAWAAAGAAVMLGSGVLLASDPTAVLTEVHGSPTVLPPVSDRDPTWVNGVAGGSRGVTAWARGLEGLAYGFGLASAATSDYSKRVEQADKFTLQLAVTVPEGGSAAWAATGAHVWHGDGEATACEGADARLDLSAVLAYTGALNFSNDATVAVADESGLPQFQYSLKDGATVVHTASRQTNVASDSTSGQQAQANSGRGASVKVDVSCGACAVLVLDTPPLMGMAAADGKTGIRGAIQMVIGVWGPGSADPGGTWPIGPTTGGGGLPTPSTGSGPQWVFYAQRTPEVLRVGPGVTIGPPPLPSAPTDGSSTGGGDDGR